MKKYVIEQSGRSMIEMLGVLAIVGVLSVAGIAGYSKAMAKYKTNKLIDQVSTVAANVRTTFAGQGNYKGLDSETAYNLGIFPEETAKDCSSGFALSCLRNAFGGGFMVTLVVDDGDATYPSGFVIGMDGLSKDACSAILSTDWGAASGFWGYDGGASGVSVDDMSGIYYKTYLNPKENLTMSGIAGRCSCNNENTCYAILGFN